MRLTDIAEATIKPVIARLVRRAIIGALIAGAAIIFLVYANAAGTLALTTAYGALNAYMIMAGIYALAALIALVVFFATRTKTAAATLADTTGQASGLLSSPKNMQIAMLVEAVMLGYTLARKSGNKSIL